MTNEASNEIVLRALVEIAPEAERVEIDPKVSLRDQIDIDSMDFLNFVMTLQKASGVRIRDTDYPKLATLEGAAAYIEKRRAEPAS